MNLEELKTEYAAQDNRATAYPIYVWVQDLQYICRSDMDEEIPGHFDAIERETDDEGKAYLAYYKYIPIEFFLTMRGAERFIFENQHNLKKPRRWIGHFHSRNHEMRGLLKEIGFRTEDTYEKPINERTEE